MEHFVVSARKYRPQTFKDVVGQQAITNTLTNAIENNHLAQALLFCGPRGVGKTTCARILAKMINSNGTETKDEDFAFNIFELDAASNNSVDDIRNLTDQVRIPPQVGKYKVYIIDEVHMLSQSAFNAFLKTLEEPPKHAIFILATTEKHKIIPTILSRCQIFDFKRITVKDAKEYLKYIAENQGVVAEDDALHIIAQKADGAMRDALSIFDRVVSFAGNNLTRQAVSENLNVLDYETYFTATDLILENNIPQLLIFFSEVLGKGFDGHHFIGGLASHFRDLLVCKNEATLSLLEVGDEAKLRYSEQSKKTPADFLLKGIELANTCDFNYKNSKNQRLLVELCLMQLASITFDGEKKNDPGFIIPASHFSANAFGNVEEKLDVNQSNTVKESPSKEIKETTQQPKREQPHQLKEINVPAQLTTEKNLVSGLSLSSIRAKKLYQENKQGQEIAEGDLPTTEFSETDLRYAWADYIKQLEANGKMSLASILHSDLPKILSKTKVWIELSNDTMKKEVEREQQPLISYLKETLKNYQITLHITVNDAATTKKAFTQQEKYDYLRKKNPMLDLLRKEFDLDF